MTTTLHKYPSHKKQDKERQSDCPILEKTKKPIVWRLNANCYPHLDPGTEKGHKLKTWRNKVCNLVNIIPVVNVILIKVP